MIIVMAVIGVWFEMRMVNSCSPLGDLLERTKVGAAIFSLLVSVGLGMLFGAEGLIVFVSGMLSTAMIQPWYRMRANGTLDKMRQQKADLRSQFDARKDVYVRRTRQVVTGVTFVVKIITFPFYVIGLGLDKIDSMKRR